MEKENTTDNHQELKVNPINVDNFLLSYSNCLKLTNNDLAKEMLSKHLNEHFDKNEYPKGIGSKIFDILIMLPIQKKAKIQFPLINKQTSDRLNSLSKIMDCSDVKLLQIICSGHSIKMLTSVRVRRNESFNDHLNEIISKIDIKNLTKKISYPIDCARSSYTIESTIADREEFNIKIKSFYSHLLPSLRGKQLDADPEALGAEAYALLSRTYANKGGINAAKDEAAFGTNGGLRYVFDAMTEQLKIEEKEAYVNYVLKTTIDPLDWDAKVYMMKCLIEKIGDNLPDDIKREPIQRYVSNWEVIVRTYVKSIEQVKSILKMY